jgi:hypothetical protein
MTAARSLAAAVLVAGLSLVSRTDARDPADSDPWPFLSTRADESEDRDPAAPVGNLIVRPNHTGAFFAYVRNPSDQDWTNLKLVIATDENGTDVLAEGTVARVKKGKTAPVKLTLKKAVAPPPPVPPPSADKDKDKDKAPPPPPPAVRLSGRVYLFLFDNAPRPGTTPEPFQNPRAPAPRVVRVAHPREYLGAIAEVRGPVSDKGGFSLDVTVSPLAVSSDAPVGSSVFRGPPCKAKLDLRPELAPGLDPDFLKAGTFEAVLAPDGKGAVLRAEGLRLGSPAGSPDQFFVSADGYDRGFWFEVDFRIAGNVLAPVFDRGYLGLGVPRFAIPGKSLPVRIEVAGREPIGEPNLLFHRTPVGDPERVTAGLPGPRDQKLSARVGEGGELLITSEVKDWVIPVETNGVFGTRPFTLGVGSAAAEAKVTLDATAPTGLRLRRLPATALRGKTLTLTAEGVDAESGVSKVVFYVGEPPPEGKPLPPGKAAVGVRGSIPTAGAKTAPPPADDTSMAAYSASLLMPDTKGPVVVGARFTNRVGLTEEVVGEVLLVDPPTTGSIKGRVVQGTTDRGQPGLEVVLMEPDAKPDAKPVATAATNAKGEFTMAGLKPGNYVVSTAKPTDYGAKASAKVTVVASDKPTGVTLSLQR